MAKALEADMKALNTNLFTKSSNITLDRVMHLFGADKIVPQEDPLFVFVIGSPGVGKTTQTRRYFGELYDSMYNVSLDTIVEHIEPYRNMTLHAYKNKVAHKKNLNENNYAHFSTIYLPIIQSEESNFSIANQNIKLRKKLGLITNMSQNKNTNSKKRKYNAIETNTKKAKTVKSAQSAQSVKSVKSVKKSGLLTILDKAIQEGINRSYNIIYDTTLNGKLDKFDKIKQMIDASKTPYNVLVLHITANAKTIQSRLKKRHSEMVKEGFLRAINPKIIDIFIKQNKTSYEAAKEKYGSLPNYKFDEIINE
jgi:predicted ABC-type ATPase